jgi:uncharacterized protein YndB with AHSA1/START domain
MVTNEHELMINRPPEQIFPLIADLNHWGRWHAGAGEVEKTSPGPVGVGTTWRVSGEVQGQRLTITLEVTGYEVNRHFTFKTTSGPIEAEDRFTLEPVNGGTRLKLRMRLPAEIADPARQQWEISLNKLKALLEKG